MLYLAYRWLLACYFMFWLLWSIVQTGSAVYLIYLTNWAFMTFNLYLLVAALSVSTTFIAACRKEVPEEDREELVVATTPPQSCGRSDNKASWYQMIQWLLFILGNEMSFLVFVYYWLLVYNGGDAVDAGSVNTHLLNGIFALIDLWVCGVPLKPLHAIYPMIYGAAYIVFTGVYHGITSKKIYDSLDYKEKPLTALLGMTAVIFAIPFVHVVVFYCQYKVKQDFLKCVKKKKRRGSRDMNQNVSFANNEVTLP